mmetsp:Transcript_44997/g.104144  ORF Transcript_44997/g.104144 Transcript_44997/m.104144 type:complete len:511 (+) Transcript_44997:87-1619(+)
MAQVAECTEIHLRPVSVAVDAGQDVHAAFHQAVAAVEEDKLLAWLRSSVGDMKISCGDVLDFGSPPVLEVAVCSTLPSSGGIVVATGQHCTQVVWNSEPVPRLQRLQMHCLDPDAKDEVDQTLYHEYLKPFFVQRLQERKKRWSRPTIFAVKAGRLLSLRRMGDPSAKERAFAARTDTMDPAGSVGAIDASTELFTHIEETAELARIDVRPYEESLPSSYEVDIFQDYLRPYFDQHRFVRFTESDHFSYQAVRFRVVATDPPEGGRVGSSTLVFSKGSLQPTLMERLPPELIEDLRRLPRGLQILLLSTMEHDNTVAQLVEAQSVSEVLKKGSGLTAAHIRNELEPPFKWTGQRALQSSQASTSSSSGSSRRIPGRTTEEDVCLACMVCLGDFEQGVECRRLRCGHAFHRQCVDEWLQRSPVCPVCKTEPIEGFLASKHEVKEQEERGAGSESRGPSFVSVNVRPQRTFAVTDSDVATLESMGVSRQEAKRALQAARGDVERACQLIWPD